jgi:hypothetical protein
MTDQEKLIHELVDALEWVLTLPDDRHILDPNGLVKVSLSKAKDYIK